MSYMFLVSLVLGPCSEYKFLKSSCRKVSRNHKSCMDFNRVFRREVWRKKKHMLIGEFSFSLIDLSFKLRIEMNQVYMSLFLF